MIKLVQQYFTASAKKFPDKTAVSSKGANITFAELEESSNQLARFLKSRGVVRRDRICFCLPKSVESIQVILGILKADAVYVPLDHRAPAARLKLIVEDVDPKLIIVDDSTAGLFADESRLLNLDREKTAISSSLGSALEYQNTSESLAYILYTSGSTGKPKGVMITHGNIINATDWAVEELDITSDDKMSQHPPLYFDLSTFDLYCAFKSGATLFLVPEELSLFPGQLVKFIEENELTVWNSVPSVMVYMSLAGLVKPGRLGSLKKIFFNGEGFPTKFLVEWMKTYPDKVFVNMYGPTETTVQCTFYKIPEPPGDLSKLVPIGRACRNVEVFGVKEDGTPVQPGEEGELYVSGWGVGKGYWQDAEKTAASFLDFPGKGRVYKTGDLVKLLPDGNYEFIGRKDNQVKVRGNRIELGDVEQTLYSLPYVRGLVADARFDTDTGGNELILYVDSEGNIPTEKIMSDCGELLPKYELPDEVIRVKSLPRTSTGKVDRIKLREEYEHGGHD